MPDRRRKEDNLPPLVWKKAVVSDLHYGRDGVVKSCNSENSNGNFETSNYKDLFVTSVQCCVELVLNICQYCL
jgi:hypothetical protein